MWLSSLCEEHPDCTYLFALLIVFSSPHVAPEPGKLRGILEPIKLHGDKTNQYINDNGLNSKIPHKCEFCKGYHWNDCCDNYKIAEDRKQLLKEKCFFLCLMRGHIATECIGK